jgi:hypothetical protein
MWLLAYILCFLIYSFRDLNGFYTLYVYMHTQSVESNYCQYHCEWKII